MNKKYIFDVDGTLTPSRQQIDSDFEKYMLDFSDKEEVYLVTGSNLSLIHISEPTRPY